MAVKEETSRIAPSYYVLCVRNATGIIRTAYNKMSEVLICPRTQGGFGNKLFQVCAALAVAMETDGRVVLCASKWIRAGPSYQRKHHDDLEDAFGGFDRMDPFPKTLDVHEKPLPNRTYMRPLWETVPIASIRAPCAIMIRGFFQHAGHITDKLLQVLCAKLRLPPVPSPARPCMFVHVRLGDYVQSPGFNFDLTVYYARSMTAFKALVGAAVRDIELVLFTDDKGTSKLLSRYMDVMRTDEFASVRTECGGDPYVSLQDMRACSWGGICAPSTFSWWAARLSAFDQPTGRFFFIPSIFSNLCDHLTVHSQLAFADPPTLHIVPVW